MSISSIAGTAGNAAMQWLESLTNNSNTTGANSATSSASGTNSNGSTQLSQVGQFFAKLESLAKNSPAEFKQLTAQISTELSSAAQQATGSAQTFLQQLANNFKTASTTGSTASLQPNQQATSAIQGTQSTGGHHHHHHHGGGGGYSSSQSSDTDSLLTALTGSSSTSAGSTSASSTSASSASGTSDIQSVLQTVFQQVMQA
jgi:hypothetical protein